MSRKSENSSFLCTNCGRMVLPLTNGSYRNHCPHCLHSLHVDNLIGDRSNPCGGLMEPIGVVHHSKKGYQIIHRCKKCGFQRVNRIAENTVMPDDFKLVADLSAMHSVKSRKDLTAGRDKEKSKYEKKRP